MPELPEVQTTVNGLNKTVKGRKILDVWTSYNSSYFSGKDNVKDPKYFKKFKKEIVGEKILKSERRAKNILIHISGDKTILIHMKMTGHLLYGEYEKHSHGWSATQEGPLKDSFNAFIRLIFTLDNGKHLALSDMRKFAKVTLLKTSTLNTSPHLKDIGPEPLEENFTYLKFKQSLYQKPKGKVKQVLLNQSIIAGIGNIYTDEMLWRGGVNPESLIEKIPEKELKAMYKAMKEVLKSGIDMGGDSMSDYRNIKGEKGEFQEHHRAYRRTGKGCAKKGCDGVIERKLVATRSSHFCPVHQKLFK